ncbi:TonB-dependent receptor [Hymenobacter caeli]|uniref:Outer membrane receptor protein involved in Fe transport n=1 Tax=Hymenobacter caeli TaxID=2735894 RepID=A0ABX2FP32_9BACT|nr:TonB-dependent receptor [Hymenobacter caeli]NRT18169.1 outer membrane receptor protein involved in Fe transport [Hymenobacter caeli]
MTLGYLRKFFAASGPLVLLWALLGAGPVAAQRPAALRGTVTDSLSGQPLAGASVGLVGQPGGTATDALGQFRLSNLAAGTYSLRVGALGSRATNQPVTLVAGETQGVEVALAATSLSLSEVTVSQPRDLNQNLAAITHIDQTLRPINSGQDLLRLVPGLFIAQHAGGGKAEQIFLRGFDADHGTDFAVSVDGLPVNMVSQAHGQGYADFHFVIPETVEALKVYKGPYTARFGDLATAGAGEFLTKTGLDHSQVKVEAGSYNTYRALVMLDLLGGHHLLSKKPENAYVASEYYYSASPFVNDQCFKRFNGMAKYTGQLTDKTSLTLFGSYFTSNWNASGEIPTRAVEEGLISRFGSIDPSEGGRTNRANAYAVLTTALPHDAVLRQQVYYTRYNFSLFSNFTFYKDNPVGGDEINQTDTGRNLYGYTGTYDRDNRVGTRNLHTTFGLGTRLDDSGLGLRHATQRAVTDTVDLGRLHEQNVNAYLDETLELTDRLTVNAAVRADLFVFDFRGQIADSTGAFGPLRGRVNAARVSPKLNFYYQASPAVQLFLRSGLGFHSNDARGVVRGINPAQALPRATGAEVGSTFKPVPDLVVNAAFWYLRLQDELVYSGDEGTTESVGPTQRFGFDLSARYQLSRRLFLDFDGNYSHARLLDAPAGENYVPLGPVFTSIAGITYKQPNGLSGSLRYRYLGGRPANEDNTVRALPYFVVDAVLAYTRPRYQFGLTVQNLLDVDWNEAQYATETQLRGEMAPVTDRTFTPGTPFNLRANASIFF